MYVIEPKSLSDLFAPLLHVYEPNSAGKLIIEWLRIDWGMFDDDRVESDRALELIAEISDDKEIATKLVAPSATYKTDSLSRWETLRSELMCTNRYFPDAKLEMHRLEELLRLLKCFHDDLPRDWYRARLTKSKVPFPIDNMGAPPSEIASHGRANPAGIPYLYLGSNLKTAIAEIRPHTGENACVAHFKTKSALSVVDLRLVSKIFRTFDLRWFQAVAWVSIFCLFKGSMQR